MSRPTKRTRAGPKSRLGLQISEHATLRFVERVMGMRREDLEGLIVPEAMRDQVLDMGDGEFPLGGHKVVVKNGIVVTVIVTGKEVD